MDIKFFPENRLSVPGATDNLYNSNRITYHAIGDGRRFMKGIDL